MMIDEKLEKLSKVAWKIKVQSFKQFTRVWKKRKEDKKIFPENSFATI